MPGRSVARETPKFRLTRRAHEREVTPGGGWPQASRGPGTDPCRAQGILALRGSVGSTGMGPLTPGTAPTQGPGPGRWVGAGWTRKCPVELQRGYRQLALVPSQKD